MLNVNLQLGANGLLEQRRGQLVPNLRIEWEIQSLPQSLTKTKSLLVEQTISSVAFVWAINQLEVEDTIRTSISLSILLLVIHDFCWMPTNFSQFSTKQIIRCNDSFHVCFSCAGLHFPLGFRCEWVYTVSGFGLF